MIDPNTQFYVQAKQDLTPQQLAVLESEMSRQRKDPLTAILLAFFLGHFGAHQFYMGRPNMGIIMLVLTLLGIPLVFVIIGIFMIVGVWIWALISCFTLSDECARYNRALEGRLIAAITAGATVSVSLPQAR